MTLSDRLFHALSNLERKRAGVEVSWINISDARELTLLGFAKRDHQGWVITDTGLAAHELQRPTPAAAEISGEIIPHKQAEA